MNSFPHPATWVHLDWVLVAVAAWLLIGVIGVFALKRFRLVATVLFPASGLISLVLLGVALSAAGSGPEVAVLPIGLPQLPFHLRLDSLSAFFLMVIGGVSAGVSLFAAGYFRQGEGTPPGLICLEYHVFLASMAMVVIADDAYAFMVVWETMAFSSFFLVMANHRIPEIRNAGYLYMLVAHIGALGILLCFGVLQANTGDYTFANMRAQHVSPFWASVAFVLAVFGFGAKAGLLPLHAWLPEAHPAAPSPMSALMSGVMLKIALYGVLRVSFDLLQTRIWWWGVMLMALGLATALFGAIFSTVQVEMKRLLAYSSIENVGLMCAGFGLSLLFSSYGMTALSALALTAALYHLLSHAFYKSLLFCSTGAVLHATGERSLGKLGGLIRYMPWVAWPSLIGVLACAGLPPFGGFVAEWLLLQSFLFTTGLPSSFLNMLVPVVAALIALIAALSGFTMVKYFGVIFLGQPREEKLSGAHDAGTWERTGMLWLAAGCVVLGLLPSQVIALIDPHLSWYGPFRFYEQRMYATDEDFALSGACILGLPMPGLGHTQYASIAMTTGGPDTADVYEETVNPDNPLKYEVDGEWRDMTTRKITLRVREGDKLVEKDFEVAATHHGPIFARKDNKAYAMALAYVDRAGLMEELYKVH
ncbi:MAG: hydrogenase 4 subunit B, partial [Rhodoferax sp.]